MKSIVLCGGGTAGHIMPNIALLDNLRKHFNKIYYIGSYNGIEKDILKDYPDIKFYGISTAKFVRGITLKNLSIPNKLIRGINQCKKILKDITPDIIFSKGGYVSLPVTYAGHKLNIPIIAHESDLSLGLANKLILKHCTKMCCSFKKTSQDLGSKGVYTLSPIRSSLFSGNPQIAKQICNFNNNKKTILFIGGSLGARAVNKVVFDCVDILTKRYNVIHIVGKGNLPTSIKNPNYYPIEFTPNIEHYFALANAIISRAGSNAINELLVLNKPMLLIPLPKGSSRGDQIENAENFNQNGFAHILYQTELNQNTLIQSIDNLIENSNQIKINQQKFYKQNGTQNIVDTILQFCTQKST